jgi:pimeloyl-ACP methyl ester carboxylesterase
MTNRLASLTLAVTLICAGHASAFAAELLETIPTRPGVTQSFIYEAPDNPPTAAILLFPGGNGVIGLSGSEQAPTLRAGGNFLVRSRHLFVHRGLLTLTLDVPSDETGGILSGFRVGADHAQDIAAVISWLRQKTNVPVWLVGTSQGTVSAAALAARLGIGIDGLVLTSSVIEENKGQDPAAPMGVLSVPLSTIKVPALLLAHDDDQCPVSPPSGAQSIADKLTASPRVVIKKLSGGKPPKSSVCEAFAQHGYYGIEDQAVDAIADFIIGK